MIPRSSPRPFPLTLVALLALAGCAAGSPTGPTPDTTPDAAVDTHGAIAGAAELAEPALGLTSIDAEGRVSHLDLLDESTTDLGAVRAPDAVHGDGRYLFAMDGDGVSIVDSGVWTWDHVDHFHYYRAEPRVLGDVAGGGVATVATSNSSTTGGTGLFFPESGDAVLLDTEALSKGRIVETFRLAREPGAGLVVPVGSFAAVAAADVLALHTADGTPTGDSADCVDPAGTITTRVGAVIGCRDAALLIHVEDERPVIERVPYPAGTTAARATAFANREGRPRVAALAGDDGIWILDTRARSWSLIPAPEPLVQVTAVDDADANLLALTRDGRVLVLDGETGGERAASAPLVAESLAAGASATLVADQQRAYLNGPVEGRLWEIDFADGARIAREFPAERSPAFFVQTGR
ncbi:ABC transporter [Microbacterium sp. IEGM 1404]|uniref:ABC transporter n=1 Tax=Microbacterium sp. IEGM 1404 TaxID=3047084 RepID=UPI0024B6872B|nr:ABC transporter [Microbacterium sp. IEGM 1404]MDI9890932.1 ABC transporter [Microbacterium sp. IEGM 1404]